MFKRFTFKGGLPLPSHKEQTKQLAIELFPTPSQIIIPLLQHTGTIAHPVVKRGDHVTIGQLIAEPGEQNSLAVHSSVSGEVQSIGLFPHPNGKNILAIEIENNGLDDKANIQPFDKSWRVAAPGELIQKIQASGITGMNGDGIPTYQKLSPPSNKPISTLIISGIESEPYLAGNLRIIVEKTEEFLTGTLMVKKITGAASAIIAIENKDAMILQALSSWLSDPRFKEISIARIQPKYPHGSDCQLVSAITKKTVPSGGTTIDIGCIVMDVSTTVAIHDAIIDGNPLYQRVITVCGPTVRSPKNFMVRIGTPIGKILEHCKIDMQSTRKIIMGGPMMGIAQSDLNAPVIKTTAGIFAYDKITPALATYPCINCGDCVTRCPSRLVPSQLFKFVKYNKLSKAIEWDIMNCIECGTCAYVCPAKINLVHYLKLGKNNIQLENLLKHSHQNEKK